MRAPASSVVSVTRLGFFACPGVVRACGGGVHGAQQTRVAEALVGGVVSISCRVDEAGAGLVGVWARLVTGIA